MSMHDGILGQGDAFCYFLWRRLARPAAWSGGVPDLLASDGQRVRRMTIADRVMTLQQYDDPHAAEAIARMVQAQARQGAGLRGYSMFRDAESVAIWQSRGEVESGWVAFPFTDLPGRAALLNRLPAYGPRVPRLRLCAGARLGWMHGHLVLEAAIEQRSDGFHDAPEGVDLMEFLTEWRLETLLVRGDDVRDARLLAPGKSCGAVLRVAPRRIETHWMLNEARFRALGDSAKLRAWFVLTFDARLFALPDPWRTWWFEVDFPDRVEL